MKNVGSQFRGCVAASFLLLSVAMLEAAHANNYGESFGWQFRTSADRANQALVLDLMEKRRGDSYRAPSYSTTIARQYNCGVNATAVGNEEAQSAIANSPSVAGPSSVATGNQSDTVVNADRDAGHNSKTQGWQSNSGTVSAGVTGSATASVGGNADQALNSTQTNSGNQAATVTDSSACTFGVSP